MTGRKRGGQAAGVLLAVVALGCAGRAKSGSPKAPPPLSGEQVAAKIDQQIPPKLPGLDAGNARCPARLDPPQDRAGFCSLRVEGQDARVKVTRSGSAYTVGLDQAVIALGPLERDLESRLLTQNKFGAHADCGSATVRVVDVGGVITCAATGSVGSGKTVTRQLDVTITDLSGGYSYADKASS